MMGRPVIRAILALLLTLVLSHSSEGGANAAEQIELTKQSDEIQASSMENSVFRAIRDAGRKSHRRKNGNSQNRKNPGKGRNKSRQVKKNTGKNKNKIGRNKKNRLNLKRKRRKNKKKLKQNNKKIRKNKKKPRAKKNRAKKGKKESRKNKKKSGQKKSKQTKKQLRKTSRKSVKQHTKKNEFSKRKPKQACDEAALCQKIKDYIKISNQLRKVRRIVKSCDTMDKKAKKSVSEFDATVTALETAILGSSSGRRIFRSRWRRAIESSNDVTTIKDKLKNCSITAKAKCQKSSVAPCQEEATLTKCETELQSWLTKFGPAKGSCLQASSDCCACITALPDVSKDCLAFDNKSTTAVASRKKCTSGDEEGSFGFCRKLQAEAAEKGPKHAKANCDLLEPSDGITTKGPSDICTKLTCKKYNGCTCATDPTSNCNVFRSKCCGKNNCTNCPSTACPVCVGCFNDQATPKLYPNLINLPANNSYANCRAKCLSKFSGSNYIGLENGNKCYCGTKSPLPATADNPKVKNFLCDENKCPGDTTTTCGGSVYIKVCKVNP